MNKLRPYNELRKLQNRFDELQKQYDKLYEENQRMHKELKNEKVNIRLILR